jgi:hypothetical protein
MELRFCDQNLLKPQLAFPHPHEGLGTETPGLANRASGGSILFV